MGKRRDNLTTKTVLMKEKFTTKMIIRAIAAFAISTILFYATQIEIIEAITGLGMIISGAIILLFIIIYLIFLFLEKTAPKKESKTKKSKKKKATKKKK